MYSSTYPFWITVGSGPCVALVGGIVVILLTWSLVVGVIAGIVGLAVGLVVGYVLMEASFRWWPSEYDPVDTETDERNVPEHDSDEPDRDGAELDDLNQVQLAMIYAMTELEQRAEDEHRELTALEKGEVKRLRAKVVEESGVHEPWRDRLLTPIAMMFSLAVIFGGTITALVVTLVVGWLLGG